MISTTANGSGTRCERAVCLGCVTWFNRFSEVKIGHYSLSLQLKFNMDCYAKCFDLLPYEMRELLPADIEGLKLDRLCYTVGRPVVCMISECANFLYRDEFLKSEVNKKLFHCLNNVRCILDITWEKLNTGYWKNVDISWRYVYSYASLFKALFLLIDKTNDIKDVIKACDMGLIMGAPILKNILSKIAFALTSRDYVAEEETEVQCKRRKTTYFCEQQSRHDNMVPEAVCPSLDEFENSYMEKKQPVILKNTIDFWPALSSRRWSVDYLMKIAHHRTVPVEIGSKYTDENWTQKLITVEEFVSAYIWNDDEHRKVGYLAQYQLFDQIPQLKEDFSIPTYCCLTDDEDIDVDINAWFGPGGTVSPLHYDSKNNLLAQVFGEKYVRLYLEEFTSSLYPTAGSKLLSNTSQVDVENPDHTKFPLFASAPYQECILKPGDVLFIPPKCWHYVRSLSVSFSISFWWK